MIGGTAGLDGTAGQGNPNIIAPNPMATFAPMATIVTVPPTTNLSRPTVQANISHLTSGSSDQGSKRKIIVVKNSDLSNPKFVKLISGDQGGVSSPRVVFLKAPPPNPAGPGGQSVRVLDVPKPEEDLNDVLDNGAIGDMFNLARVEMEDGWVMFVPRTFTVICGDEGQPIPGVILLVQKSTRRFFLTVFLQVCQQTYRKRVISVNTFFFVQVLESGILETVQAFKELCRSAFGPERKLRCLGLNSKATGRFQRTKFSPGCVTLCDVSINDLSKDEVGVCKACQELSENLQVGECCTLL